MKKPSKSRKPKYFQHTIRPALSAYQAVYPGNPVLPVLKRLCDQGRLDLEIDERAYLADLIAEGLARESEVCGLGAAIMQRMNVWLKGLMRSDVS